MKPFSRRIDKLMPSASIAMAQAAKRETAGMDIIDLTWGQPDFDTPEHIKEAAYDAISAGKNGYTPAPGIPELREAISNFHASQYRTVYDPSSEVLVTPGAKQGLMYLLQLLIDPGDEVILFEPCWLSYRDMVFFNQGIPKFIPANSNLSPDLNALENVISPRTKAILINNPVNPSGYVFSGEELGVIAELAEKYDLYVIADEIYDRIVFTEFISLSEFKNIRERLIIANGFSKAYAMTGWRIGYLLGPSRILFKVSLIHQHTATCASAPSQYAAVAALTGSQDSVDNMTKTYKKRRDFFVDKLEQRSFNLIKPQGTFYAMLEMPEIPPKYTSNSDFFLNEYGIATVDGISYGESAKIYVRLSLTKDADVLMQTANRLKIREGFNERAQK